MSSLSLLNTQSSVNTHLLDGWSIEREAENETLELTRPTSSLAWDISRSIFYVASAPIIFLGTALGFAAGCIVTVIAAMPPDHSVIRRDYMGREYRVTLRETTSQERLEAGRRGIACWNKVKTIWDLNSSYRKMIRPWETTYETKRINDDRFSVSSRSTKTNQKISRVSQVSLKAKNRKFKARSTTSGIREEE